MLGRFGDIEILEFIERRFPNDCNWMNGNCYFFAQILQFRFKGEIYYEPIDGHFLFLYSKDGLFYDWTGARILSSIQQKAIVRWDKYQQIDNLHYQRILKDCIL